MCVQDREVSRLPSPNTEAAELRGELGVRGVAPARVEGGRECGQHWPDWDVCAVCVVWEDSLAPLGLLTSQSPDPVIMQIC